MLQLWRQYVRDCRQGTLDSTMSAEFRSSCVGFVSTLGAYLHSADTGAPRSLCLRILYAGILHNLERDDDALSQLARIPPPFGSWTSSPASEDDWLDPADEASIGPGNLCDWEEQVSSWVCGTLSPRLESIFFGVLVLTKAPVSLEPHYDLSTLSPATTLFNLHEFVSLVADQWPGQALAIAFSQHHSGDVCLESFTVAHAAALEAVRGSQQGGYCHWI